MATFIPGYLAEVTIGGDSLEGEMGSGTLAINKNIMLKSVAGTQFPTALAGLVTGTLSVSGHISVENFGKFETARASNAAIAYIFQLGEDGGATDAGKYGGNMLVESLTPAFDADDEFVFSMDCVLSGEPVYTAPV